MIKVVKCKDLEKKKNKGIPLTKEQLKEWNTCVELRREESSRKQEERKWVAKQLH